MLDFVKVAAGTFLATMCVNFLMHTPKRALFPCALMGMLGYTIYWGMMQLGVSDPLSMFVGSFIASILAEGFARRLHMAATIFITTSIIPLVPGLAFYRFMSALAQNQLDVCTTQGIYAMKTILIIALSVAVSSSIYAFLYAGKKRRPHSM
ncbi:MAG: threonine/serine exporter family protein [Eubacteriales bacterium]|nr:threonine/serine exporter family protein [Eubacteriales bacterium]MDD3882391.1 threonine/serine exporter family protein [Eubacteriales bacterium]MDD4512388.1 threonine/serine exporter family protein [Eubacteriales bacterium]